MKKTFSKSFPSLSIRIDLGPGVRIGPGKISLLETIQKCGSISAAGRELGMSYKRAWDLVDEISTECGHSAVERQTGGKHGGGATLTAFGESLIERYRAVERESEKAVHHQLIALKSGLKTFSKK